MSIGAASNSRRSSDRKNVDRAVTTPLNARKDSSVRNNHDRPSRSRKSPNSAYWSSCNVTQKLPPNSAPSTARPTHPNSARRTESPRSRRRARLRDDQNDGSNRYGNATLDRVPSRRLRNPAASDSGRATMRASRSRSGASRGPRVAAASGPGRSPVSVLDNLVYLLQSAATGELQEDRGQLRVVSS